jgi:hypothetical protein
LRRVRLVAPVQLGLTLDGFIVAPVDRWASLPEPCRREAMLLLARLISRGVLETEADNGTEEICDG